MNSSEDPDNKNNGPNFFTQSVTVVQSLLAVMLLQQRAECCVGVRSMA